MWKTVITRDFASIVLVLDSGWDIWFYFLSALPPVSQQEFPQHPPAGDWHGMVKNGQRSAQGTMEGKRERPPNTIEVSRKGAPELNLEGV